MTATFFHSCIQEFSLAKLAKVISPTVGYHYVPSDANGVPSNLIVMPYGSYGGSYQGSYQARSGSGGSGLVAGGGGRRAWAPPSDNFLGALKFAIANVKYLTKYVKSGLSTNSKW